MIKKLNRVISMILVVIMVTAMMPMSVISTSAATVEGESVGISGSGTASSPYLIGTVDDYKQFVTLANSDPTVCGKLTANIQLNSYSLNSSTLIPPWGSQTVYTYTPIGTSSKPYTGTFDGAGYTINGFCFSNTSETNGKYAGVFGFVESGGVIKNLTLTNTYVNAYTYAGALCGNSRGTIQNCNVRRTKVITVEDHCGGICGWSNSIISNCSVQGLQLSGGDLYTGGICGNSSGPVTSCTVSNYDCSSSISGKSYVGGICGSACTINKCNNILSVTATKNFAGGICGTLYGKITDCYASCKVTAVENSAGGICGLVQYNSSNSNILKNCFYYYNSSGAVTAPYYAGAIIGKYYNGTISNCYYNSADVAKDGNGQVQNGVGNATTGSSTADGSISNVQTVKKTSAQFKSGEVAWLLNNGVTNGTQAFYQTVNSTSYPDFSGKTVYYGYPACNSTTMIYSNTAISSTKPAHTWSNGKCTVCGISCTHTWSNGKCTVCGISCTHTWSNGKCTVCGISCTHTWSNGKCSVCGTACTHKWSSGKCSVCGISCTHKWSSGKCTVCGISCTHTWSNGKCTVCEISCTHTWSNGKCTVCGLACTHSYSNGFCTVCDAYQPATDSDGDGYYEINNGGKLYWFASQVNGGNATLKAELTANITINSNVINSSGTLNSSSSYRAWTPIGNTSVSYAGEFDGANYTISGLYFNNTGTDRIGLFGNVQNAKIKNVGVIGSYFNGKYAVGAICGKANTGSEITNCYNKSTVNGNNHVAGICGDNAQGTITKCYNTGVITGVANKVAGIAGSNWGSTTSTPGTIDNCYNTGTISGSHQVGGLVGSNYNSILKNSHNYGTVNGNYYVGGICGQDTSGTITNCYYLENKATDSNGTKQFGVGNATAGSTTADTSSRTVKKTATQFKSGEVAYYLNGKTATSSSVWRQTVNSNSYPTLSGSIVYYGYANCGSEPIYSNTALNPTKPAHKYVNGFCSVCDDYEEAKDTDGDGYYEINNGGKLYWFSEQVNGGDTTLKAELTKDIYVNKNVLNSEGELSTGTYRQWTPIGNDTIKYAGIFDGGNYTVSGLYFNDTTVKYVGLFGQTASGSEIKNVGVIGSYFEAKQDMGAVVAVCYGTITNCYNTSSVISTGNYIGGVCGHLLAGSITECYNKGNVTGAYSVGGVVGNNDNDYIDGIQTCVTKCYNLGTVNGNGNTGGVTGYNRGGYVNNCYNLGSVYGKTSNIGGVSGFMNAFGGVGEITNCYNIGEVNGVRLVGSVCGNPETGTITNCYYLENTAKDSNGTVQFGVGNATAGSTTADVDGQTTAKTTEQFASGEVTYLLNNKSTASSAVWKQTLGTDDYPLFTGKTVYGCYEDCFADITYSNEKPEYEERPTHNFVDGTCTICDEVLAVLEAGSLTLDGQIGVNLYISFLDVVFEDEAPTLKLNVPQGVKVNGKYELAYETVEFDVNNADFIEQNGEYWYQFTCWVSAKEMTAPIIAQLELSDGTLSKTMTYTVKQYGDTIFDSKYGTIYEDQYEIVKSLLNYGTYAQQYFSYRTDELPNTGDYFTEEERSPFVLTGGERFNFIYHNKLVLDKGTEDKVKYYGSSLLLEEDTVIRHYFTLADSSVDVSTLTVTIDGASATVEKKGNYYYVDIKDIPAYNIDKKYVVCIDTMTLEYSCLSYAASVLDTYTNTNGACTNASKQSLVNVAKALYKYSEATKSYTSK